jgi:uncharacterized protein YdaU (DUF1376 family)
MGEKPGRTAARYRCPTKRAHGSGTLFARLGAPMEYFPCFGKDLLEGTQELTLKQQGVYFRLINVLYVRDGYIIDDDRLIARLISVDLRTWKSVKRDLIARRKYWLNGDGMVRVPRFETTLKTVTKIREKSRRSHRDLTEIDRDRLEKVNHFNGTRSQTKTKRKTQSREEEGISLLGNSFPPPAHGEQALDSLAALETTLASSRSPQDPREITLKAELERLEKSWNEEENHGKTQRTSGRPRQ